ncbi:MAG: riboflavin synthase [Motiliproteus sp.]|jgi:riboflavin synthase
MFTGIIQAIGEVADTRLQGGDLRLRIFSGLLDLSDVILGDSIAVNGVCLTVVDLPGDGFWADVSQETLAHTEFELLGVGDAVNLEKALLPSSRLGGHMVSGHVDGIGRLLERREAGRSVRFWIEAPAALARYIATKGSITVDGVSLTVNAVSGRVFELNIVPHTLEGTLLNDYRAGRRVNLEVDMIARYLERLLQGDAAAGTPGAEDAECAATGSDPQPERLSRAFLAEHGF